MQMDSRPLWYFLNFCSAVSCSQIFIEWERAIVKVVCMCVLWGWVAHLREASPAPLSRRRTLSRSRDPRLPAWESNELHYYYVVETQHQSAMFKPAKNGLPSRKYYRNDAISYTGTENTISTIPQYDFRTARTPGHGIKRNRNRHSFVPGRGGSHFSPSRDLQRGYASKLIYTVGGLYYYTPFQ